MHLFIEQLWTNPPEFFGIALLVIFSISCHEFMHAYAALKLGDDTAARAGHLTLNPLRQMGPWSLVMFAFFGLAWGQVPVNRANLRGRGSRVLVALAGVSANLVLAVLFALLTAAVAKGGERFKFACWMFACGSSLNFTLLLLNLLPIPGLDGWAALDAFFPRLQRQDSELVKGAFFVLFMLALLGIRYLFALGWAATAVTVQLFLACFFP